MLRNCKQIRKKEMLQYKKIAYNAFNAAVPTSPTMVSFNCALIESHGSRAFGAAAIPINKRMRTTRLNRKHNRIQTKQGDRKASRSSFKCKICNVTTNCWSLILKRTWYTYIFMYWYPGTEPAPGWGWGPARDPDTGHSGEGSCVFRPSGPPRSPAARAPGTEARPGHGGPAPTQHIARHGERLRR